MIGKRPSQYLLNLLWRYINILVHETLRTLVTHFRADLVVELCIKAAIEGALCWFLWDGKWIMVLQQVVQGGLVRDSACSSSSSSSSSSSALCRWNWSAAVGDDPPVGLLGGRLGAERPDKGGLAGRVGVCGAHRGCGEGACEAGRLDAAVGETAGLWQEGRRGCLVVREGTRVIAGCLRAGGRSERHLRSSRRCRLDSVRVAAHWRSVWCCLGATEAMGLSMMRHRRCVRANVVLLCWVSCHSRTRSRRGLDRLHSVR
jgi:hypothetical protein